MLAAVWRVRVGRVRLFLLDTDLEENAPWDRELSARLYGGDRETRIQQEIILGIGGVRVLRALGIEPAVWHLNEGHAAFVALQRIRELVERGSSFDDALDEVRRTTVFTTHTPVPAGHDAFPFQLVEKHLAGCWGEIGQYRQRFLALGEYDNGSGPQFNMTALALRTAAHVNGVSALHGDVTRAMWQPIWPDLPAERVPVKSITNGVHVPTWIAMPMLDLFNRHLGPDWLEHHDDPEFWDRLNDIPDEEIWAARQKLRAELFIFIRERLRQRWAAERVGADPHRRGRRDARSRRAHHRLRAPLHRLQASRADLSRRRAAGAHSRRAATGRCRSCSPARRIPRTIRRSTICSRCSGARSIRRLLGRVAFIDDYDMHVAHCLVGGLRRVAEQPAQAASKPAAPAA